MFAFLLLLPSFAAHFSRLNFAFADPATVFATLGFGESVEDETVARVDTQRKQPNPHAGWIGLGRPEQDSVSFYRGGILLAPLPLSSPPLFSTPCPA